MNSGARGDWFPWSFVIYVASWRWPKNSISLVQQSDCTLSSRPLSRAIKELEEDLGAQLFVRTTRTTRSTRMTRAGKLFLEHVPRVFSALQQARDSVKAAANGFHSPLRVALSDGIPPSATIAVSTVGGKR